MPVTSESDGLMRKQEIQCALSNIDWLIENFKRQRPFGPYTGPHVHYLSKRKEVLQRLKFEKAVKELKERSKKK
jgi:hypothetical protein